MSAGPRLHRGVERDDGWPGRAAGHPHALTNAELRVAAEMIVRGGATPLQARRRLDHPDPRLGHRTPRAVLRAPGGLGAVLAAVRGETVHGGAEPSCAPRQHGRRDVGPLGRPPRAVHAPRG